MLIAFCIGVDSFDDPKIPDSGPQFAPSALESASAVKTFLGGSPGYDRKRSRFLANPSSTRVFDELEALRVGPSAASSGDVVFVYFATRRLRRVGEVAAVCSNARRELARFSFDGCVPAAYLRSVARRSSAEFVFAFDWFPSGFDVGDDPGGGNSTGDAEAGVGRVVWTPTIGAATSEGSPGAFGVLASALVDVGYRRRDSGRDVRFDADFFRAVVANAAASKRVLRFSEVDPWEGTRPGDRRELVVAGETVGFCWAPPGAFAMGSPESERGRRSDEALRRVAFDRGFWAAETETTQELWKAITGTNPSQFRGKNRPVENVSWVAARDFIDRLNASGAAPLGWTFALPTEAEWEYACRAGEAASDASESLDRFAWFERNSDGRPREVKLKEPNPWGIYDALGNVAEWCADKYVQNRRAASSDSAALRNDSEDVARTIRGGAWFSAAERCRAASRDKDLGKFAETGVGLRVFLRAVDE